MRQNFFSDDAPEQGKADLLQLTPEQQKVVECLNGVETEKYPLSRCYLGAISTLKNIHNPDRHAQAAHSLRELIEKISYIMNSSMPGFDPCGKREKIGTALHKAKRRYDGSWCGKSIDIDLEKLLLLVEEYIEQNSLITRNEKITGALCSNDPLFHVNFFYGQFFLLLSGLILFTRSLNDFIKLIFAGKIRTLNFIIGK